MPFTEKKNRNFSASFTKKTCIIWLIKDVVISSIIAILVVAGSWTTADGE